MQRSTRWLGTLTAMLLVSATVSAVSAQTSLKVGVFDPQRVSEETIEGKRIQAKLQDLRDQRQKEIAEEEKAINDAQQQLSQQSLSLSPEKRAQMEIDIQRRLLELNSRKDVVSRSFQLEIASQEAQFNEKLRNAVTQFAHAEEFSLVFEVGAVAYASPTIDVTTAIIDVFNKLYPGSDE